MLWRYVEDWQYELFELDTSPAEFLRHQGIMALWNSKRVDGNLPFKNAFSFEDFREWIGWISIADVIEPDGSTIRYRLWGTHIASLTHLEMTGKTMQAHHGDRIDATNFNDTDLDFVREIVGKRLIGLCAGPVDGDMPAYKNMATLRLPLTRDGTTVGCLLNAVVAW